MFVLGHLGLTLFAGRLLAPLASSGERFPVGFLLVGALLPDLIDKPLGHALLPWDNGRLWAHTLLFAGLLIGLAVLTASRRVSAVGLGTAIHQLLDQAWQDPASWLWPFAGPFPRSVSTGMPDWLTIIATDPFIWATELAGLVALGAFLAAPWLGWTPRWWAPGEPAPVEEPTAEQGEASGRGETLSP